MIGPGFAGAVGSKTVKMIAIVLLTVAIIAAAIGYTVALWRECLSDHPWWYCLGIIH